MLGGRSQRSRNFPRPGFGHEHQSSARSQACTKCPAPSDCGFLGRRTSPRQHRGSAGLSTPTSTSSTSPANGSSTGRSRDRSRHDRGAKLCAPGGNNRVGSLRERALRRPIRAQIAVTSFGSKIAVTGHTTFRNSARAAIGRARSIDDLRQVGHDTQA